MLRCRVESVGVSLPAAPAPIAPGALWHAVWAGNKCLYGSQYRRSDVELLIHSGVHRDGHVCEPAIASYVLDALHVNVEFRGRRTLGFDLLNGGCGMLNAAQVLSTLIQAGQVRVGLITASEANSDRVPDAGYDVPQSGVAALLDVAPRADGSGFDAFAFHTEERYAGLYSSVVSMHRPHGQLLLRRSPELESAYLECAASALDQLLQRGGLRRDQIDLVVPAQISARLLQRLPAALGLPRARVLDLTHRLPDTLSTSTFIALQHALERQLLGPGQRALLMSFGSGVTVGAASYTV